MKPVACCHCSGRCNQGVKIDVDLHNWIQLFSLEEQLVSFKEIQTQESMQINSGVICSHGTPLPFHKNTNIPYCLLSVIFPTLMISMNLWCHSVCSCVRSVAHGLNRNLSIYSNVAGEQVIVFCCICHKKSKVMLTIRTQLWLTDKSMQHTSAGIMKPEMDGCQTRLSYGTLVTPHVDNNKRKSSSYHVLYCNKYLRTVQIDP